MSTGLKSTIIGVLATALVTLAGALIGIYSDVAILKERHAINEKQSQRLERLIEKNTETVQSMKEVNAAILERLKIMAPKP